MSATTVQETTAASPTNPLEAIETQVAKYPTFETYDGQCLTCDQPKKEAIPLSEAQQKAKDEAIKRGETPAGDTFYYNIPLKY